MIIYKSNIPDHFRVNASELPATSRNRKSSTPLDNLPQSVSIQGNPFAKYECGRPAPGKPLKHMRRAPSNAPEWYGVEDDLVLITIWECLDVRDGHKHRRLSKQMKRVCTRSLEKKLSLSPEQAVAWTDAMGGRNVFLTGGAGVGKSHTLTQIVKYLPLNTYVVTASTGCAAAIIGAATLHSTMSIGLGTQPAKYYAIKIKKQVPAVLARIRTIKTLILDECSMLDGATFNKAGLVAAMLRRNYNEDLMGNTAAFTMWDGLQIICCGDFMQLPPVQVKENGWIFNSRAWKELQFRNHVLTWIHRQSGDPTFAEVLSRARIGRATANDVVYLKANSAQEEPENCLKLFARNKPADELNQSRFRALVSGGAMPHSFNAIDHAEKPENLAKLEQCQAPKQLWLCVGARVMCLRNLIEGILVNGSTGTVINVTPYHDPELNRITHANVCVEFDGMLGAKSFEHQFKTYCSLMPAVEVSKVYEFTVHDGKKKIASRIQLPLRLAWAVSIHKSQGMSLERASIDMGGVFENGQAYTALSRMRTLAGAYIRGLAPTHLGMVSQIALKWYDGLAVEEWSRV